MFSWEFQKKVGVSARGVSPSASTSAVRMFHASRALAILLLCFLIIWLGGFWTLLGLLTRNHWLHLYFSALGMSVVTATVTWSSVTAWLWISITKCHLPQFSMLPKLCKAAHVVSLICFSPVLPASPADEKTIYCLMFHGVESMKRIFQYSYLSSLVLKFKLFYFVSFSYPRHFSNPAVLDQGGSNIASFHDLLSSHPIAESGTACDWSPIHLLQGIQSTCLYLNSNSKEYSNTFLGFKEVPLAFSTMPLPLANLWLGQLRTQRTRDGFANREK